MEPHALKVNGVSFNCRKSLWELRLQAIPTRRPSMFRTVFSDPPATGKDRRRRQTELRPGIPFNPFKASECVHSLSFVEPEQKQCEGFGCWEEGKALSLSLHKLQPSAPALLSAYPSPTALRVGPECFSSWPRGDQRTSMWLVDPGSERKPQMDWEWWSCQNFKLNLVVIFIV